MAVHVRAADKEKALLAHQIVHDQLCDFLLSRHTQHVELYPLFPRFNIVECASAVMTIDGYLSARPDGYAIKYNQDSCNARKRFTIAHELGHVMLARAQGKRARDSQRMDDGYHSEEEELVDMIAAELLMPTNDVLEFATRQERSWHAIRSLSNRFNVSMTAAARRVLNLPGVVGIWIRCGEEFAHSLSIRSSASVTQVSHRQDQVWSMMCRSNGDRHASGLEVIDERFDNSVQLTCEVERMTRMRCSDRIWGIGWKFEHEIDVTQSGWD